jgi:hypothetical protein
MPVPSDPYDFVEGTDAVADQVDERFKRIYDTLNPAAIGIDDDNIAVGAGIAGSKLADDSIVANKLATALAEVLGVNTATGARRGASIIDAEQTRSNAAFGLLGTADRVQGIELPSNGLIRVWFQAIWFQSVTNAAGAAIFIGGNQVTISNDAVASAPPDSATSSFTATGVNTPLFSYPGGLQSGLGTAAISASHDADAQAVGAIRGGAVLGGPCTIFAPAGTYDISVQFKASSGSVTVRQRKLWVEAVGF